LLDFNNSKFTLVHCSDGYLGKFLERLKAINQMELSGFQAARSDALRIHPIDFSATSEPEGFTSLNEQLRDNRAWQFQITRSEHGRVHGIMIDEVFYIVWLDPCHLLYSKSKWCDAH
jgi:hypothetical protein